MPISVQLRIGGDKRRRFKVATQERADELRELAHLVVARHLPLDLAYDTLVQAAEASAEAFTEIRGMVNGFKAHAKPDPLRTVEGLGRAWTDGELHRRWPDHVKQKRSAYDDNLRLSKHIYPIIGRVPLKLVTLDHAERVMRSLDPALSPATRRQVAQLMGRLLALAVYPVRAIKASPIPKGWLPSAGDRKAYAILYPADDAKLLACTAVPLKYRVAYGFAHRELLRRGEIAALRWADLDLVNGALRVDRGKTSARKFFRLSAGVANALTKWRDLAPKSDLVFPEIDWAHAGRICREHLRTAGITRPELFERTDEREHWGFHSWRRSGITRGLAVGRTDDAVRQRSGHVSSELLRYRQAATALAELELGDVLPLDEAIPELRDPPKEGGPRTGTRHTDGFSARSGAFERGDSADKRTKKRELTRGRLLGSGDFGRESSSLSSRTYLESLEFSENVSQSTEAAGPADCDGRASASAGDPTRAALTAALQAASDAGQWDVVKAIAEALAKCATCAALTRGTRLGVFESDARLKLDV